jgi:hypothetical protein
MFTLPSMWNLIISTIVFFVAAWYARRYMDEQEIPRGMTRGIVIFVLASFVSLGAGKIVDWTQEKTAGPQTAQHPGNLAPLPKATGQPQQ